MAKKTTSSSKEGGKDPGFLQGLREETAQGIYSILLFVAAIFFILSAFHIKAKDIAGPVGGITFSIFNKLLGFGYFLLPLLCVLLGISFLKVFNRKYSAGKVIGGILFFVAGMGLMNIAT